MTGKEFSAVAYFLGFEAAMWMHNFQEDMKAIARRRNNPRLRRESGGWACVRAHSAVGFGATPSAAYHDWREKLTLDEHE